MASQRREDRLEPGVQHLRPVERRDIVARRDRLAGVERRAQRRAQRIAPAPLVAVVAFRHLGELDALARRRPPRRRRPAGRPRSTARRATPPAPRAPPASRGRPPPSRAAGRTRRPAAAAAATSAVASSRGAGAGAVARSRGSWPKSASASSAASGHRPREHPDGVEARALGEDPGARDRPEARLEADDAAEGRRPDHRARRSGCRPRAAPAPPRPPPPSRTRSRRACAPARPGSRVGAGWK